MLYNLGNVVGLLVSETPPVKKYILWGRVLNPAFPDEIVIYKWSFEDNDWIPSDAVGAYFLPPVISQLDTPPASPTAGDKYLVGTSPTGAFSTKANNHAAWSGHQWIFTPPKQGSVTNIVASGGNYYKFLSNTWNLITGSGGTINGQSVIISGDGVSTIYSIAHGLSYTPNVISAIANSSAAVGFDYVDADNTTVYFHYTIAPPFGTSNIKLSYILS